LDLETDLFGEKTHSIYDYDEDKKGDKEKHKLSIIKEEGGGGSKCERNL
jgi:hypothetical protein